MTQPAGLRTDLIDSDYRFDLLHIGDVSDLVDFGVSGPETMLADVPSFVQTLYRHGFESGGDPQPWPFGRHDQYASAVFEGQPVVVGYGPGPDGEDTWAAYEMIIPASSEDD